MMIFIMWPIIDYGLKPLIKNYTCEPKFSMNCSFSIIMNDDKVEII